MVADAVVRAVDVRGLRRQRKTLLRRKHGQVWKFDFYKHQLFIELSFTVYSQLQPNFPNLNCKEVRIVFVSINESDRIDKLSFNKSLNIDSLKTNLIDVIST